MDYPRHMTLLVLAFLALQGCGNPATRPAEEPIHASQPEAERPPFEDATEDLGLAFEHRSGATGEYHFPEINGAGAALFDADADGDLDLYLVSSAPFPDRDGASSDRLYRNDLENGKPHLVDVTAASGLAPQGYGMGVATADFDGDGLVDLYLTNLGPDQLLRNLGPDEAGNPRFEDVTATRHPGNARWALAATFADFDRDGHPDLFVGNYVAYDAAAKPSCRTQLGGPDYCGPLVFPSEPDTLYRNRGDGTFEDVSTAAGFAGEVGNTMGAVAADFDGDGWLDLYVANDQQPNHLWLHRGLSDAGRPTFQNAALLAGVGVNREGQAEASMGVDAGDFDGDGDLDLFLAHLDGETNTLYQNDGTGLFVDATNALGLAAPSRPRTAFGAAFLDYDHDGWLDLLVANGAVTAVEDLLQAQDPWPFHQPNQLFRNRGGADFEEVEGIPALVLSEVSRGAAFGDLDNDGDRDVVILNNQESARVLLNTVGQDRPWLGLRLTDATGRVDQLGARVEIQLEDGRTLLRRVHTDGSYASASDPRIQVGLGVEGSSEAVGIEDILVHWVQGATERFSAPEPGLYHTLRQGSGEVVRESP